MKKILKRPQALIDIQEIIDHIAKDSLGSAKNFLSKTENTFHQISLNPKIGTLRDYNNKNLQGLRFLPIDNFEKYLILYFIQDDFIEIMDVIYGARDLKNLLKDVH